MFTGIIEETGVIKKIIRTESYMQLFISGKTVLLDTKPGDSISINGVCLTVTSLTTTGFYVDVMPETVKRSSLGTFKEGEIVNLERAMPANGRFGGHIVSGHIDGTGHLKSFIDNGNSIIVTILAAPQITELIVEKGSIAIDGISLTVTKVFPESFQTAIIPHTQKNTCLIQKKAGDIVNLENDIIGKYIKNFIADRKSSSDNITIDYLKSCGF